MPPVLVDESTPIKGGTDGAADGKGPAVIVKIEPEKISERG
jgi:hypothetical protein